MSKDIIVNQQRNGVTLTPVPIPVRLQQMNWKIAADMGGASPYDSWWMHSLQGVGMLDIKRKDLLIDTVTNVKYRVFGRPDVFDQSTIRLAVEEVSGT